MPPEEFLQHARFPLEKMHPDVRSFWYAYRRALNLDTAQSDAFLIKAIRYAAARLLQTAFERVQHATQVTGEAVLLLQLSMNVLERPREATVQLLGMQLP
jgi:sigma54-dependent transcription regulator